MKIPFTFAENNDQLEKDIIEFDQEKYDRVLDKFQREVGLVFEGNLSERLAGKIVKKIAKRE